MKKKLLVMLLGTAMAVSALWGCSGNTKTTADGNKTAQTEDNGEVVELEFWAWWSSEARKPYVEEMVQGFNESQSKYHVTYIDIPWGDIFTKNIAQIAAGKPCDIMVNKLEEVKFRANEGQVEPLNAYLADGIQDEFYDQYMDACTGEDGSIYALPLSVDTRVIYYNKAHFEEAGVKAEDIKTWKDLEEAAHKLDIKNESKYERVGFLPTLGNGNVDSWLVNANGGPCWFEEGTGNPIVNSAVNKEGFAWIKSWTDYYGMSTLNELDAAFKSGMADPFASGSLSMVLQTSAYTAALAKTAPDMDYGILMMPEFKEGNGNTVNGGGFVLEIPKGAKNPEGSYEFIKYVVSRETQDFLCTNLGDFSARNDFDENTEFFKKPHISEISEALKQTSTVVVPNSIKGFEDVINQIIDEGTLGLKPTDQVLDQAQKAFEDYKSDK